MALRSLILVAALATVGCRTDRGNGQSLTAPTGSPTVVALTITGPRVVPRSSTGTYSVSVRLSDGHTSTHPGPVIWTTDNPSVATITDRGSLTALSPGSVTIGAAQEGRTATLVVIVPADNDPGGANLVISYDPDPAVGSSAVCGGAFWGSQAPTWRLFEIIRETRGVGFTLRQLTFNYYDAEGQQTLTVSFTENHYFPPYDEHAEDGCVALNGARSGTFEEILEGIDDKGNTLTFVGRVRLLPVP